MADNGFQVTAGRRAWSTRQPGKEDAMSKICSLEREMTEPEFACINAGFDEYTREQGNPVATPERFGFVVMDGERFVGCATGLADRNDHGYANWFYLTDLFLEKAYRKRGLGAEVLGKLEDRVAALGISNIWTWTAGYEAPAFYKKQAYEIFCELENWYPSGHSRIGLRKTLLH